MEFVIYLQDNENVSHDRTLCILDSKATLDQLRAQVQDAFNISHEHQRLFVNGVQLLFGTLAEAELKDRGTVVVKHCLLEVWSTYLALCTRFNNTRNTKSLRTELAHEAIDCREQLKNSTFFKVYARLRVRLADSIGPMMRFVDRTRTALEQAATLFFSKKYPDLKIDFNRKDGGTRTGIIVLVIHNDKTRNYYMKTYHRAGLSRPLQSTSERYLPDLREMLAYRLLELIGVGPVVFFPFYTGSKYIHYIATEEVSGFEELNKMGDENLNESHC